MVLLLNTATSPYTAMEIQAYIGADQDGRWGPQTASYAAAKLGNPVDDTGRPWKQLRLTVGVIQLMLNEEGADLVVDGILGDATIRASEAKKAGLLKKPEPVPQNSAEPEKAPSLMARIWSYFGRA